MAENYVLLETIELTQSAATVVFNNIPQTGYTDLLIKISGRTSRAAVQDGVYMVLNGVNSTGFINIEANGSSASSVGSASYGVNWVAYTPGGDTTSNTFGPAEIYITNYSSTSLFKTISTESSFENNATSSNMALTSALWSQTAAVNEISFGCNAPWIAGSTFSLYGISQVGTTPVTAPFATGGNIVANDGTYWYHAFLSSGTFTPFKDLSCDILQIAGGGAGGHSNGAFGGGGGAGGLLYYAAQSLTATAQTVTIGAGGTSTSSTSTNTNGSNSQFGSLTASTGGGGGGESNNGRGGNGGNGGSGGGGGTNGSTFNAGSASPTGQGNNGSAGSGVGNSGAGAGGGAGAVGGAKSGANGGAGGAGLNTYSSWATATSTGVSGFYAGGGGGGAGTSGTGGAGGSGGGGAGTTSTAPTAAIANTGGGGGGRGETNAGAGGNGGSGIVIVRYTMV